MHEHAAHRSPQRDASRARALLVRFLPPWLLCLLLTSCGASSEPPDVITLRTAQLTISASGENKHTTRNVELPFDWDLSERGRSGHAEFVFEFAHSPTTHSDEPFMLFIPSISNAYSVNLNGIVIAAAGSLDDIGERWAAKQPVGISFPSAMLTDNNRLTILLRADAGRRAGLTPLRLAPIQTLEPIRAQAYRFRFIPTLAATLFALAVSGFCLLLWLQHRDPLFAWASMAELIWAVIVFDVVLEWTPLRWPAWGHALVVLLAVWIVVLHNIIAQVFGERSRVETLAIRSIAVAVIPAIAITVLSGSPTAIELWRAVSAISVAALAIRLVFAWRVTPSVERALLALGIILLFVAALVDAFAAPLLDRRFSDSFWGEYAGTFLGITILWAVGKRFQHARAETSRLQATLAARIEQKELELRSTFERLSAMEQAKAAHTERERILRDMHDGVGANLSAAVRQLESGSTTRGDVATTLRDSLDRLKLSIDAMGLPPGDINSLLASLRYRLNARIESAGIQLEWDVAELPHWPDGTDHTMRRLQLLMHEAISMAANNGATQVKLSAHAHGGYVDLLVVDNRAHASADTESSAFEHSVRGHAKSIGAQLTQGPAELGIRLRVATS